MSYRERHASVDGAARERGGARALRRGAPGDDHLRGARRPHGGRDPRAHARQRRLARLLRACSCSPCAVHAPIGLRPVLTEWLRLARRARAMFVLALFAACCSRGWGCARCWRCSREQAIVVLDRIVHRSRASRSRSSCRCISGRWASACELDAFLRWTEQPLVQGRASGAIVVLLAAHLGGGLRVLAIEFLDWHEWQKSLAAAAAALALAVGLGLRAGAVE